VVIPGGGNNVKTVGMNIREGLGTVSARIQGVSPLNEKGDRGEESQAEMNSVLGGKPRKKKLTRASPAVRMAQGQKGA